jgi:hypothetical protein
VDDNGRRRDSRRRRRRHDCHSWRGRRWIPDAQISPSASSMWSERYGQRHRLIRIVNWPGGILPPRKVRIYVRAGHFVLQWWDPGAKRNLTARVNGDVIAAIGRRNSFDAATTSSSGCSCRSCSSGFVPAN